MRPNNRQGDVETPSIQALGQIALAAVEYFQDLAGFSLPVPGDERLDRRGRYGGKNADTQHARLGRDPKLLDREIELRGNPPRSYEKPAARGSEGHASLAAIEEPAPEFRFQLGDADRQSGLRYPDASGRTAEISQFGDR